MVVTTAVVGAGVVAFGAGSVLPQQTEGATAALDKASTAAKDQNTLSAEDVSANQARSASVGRASRTQSREGSPTPTIMAEWARPATGPLSSLYGARWGAQHLGLDIAAAYGSTVVSASAGKVIFSGWNGGYGKLVIVEHPGGYTTRYGHNSALLVEVGEQVEAGTPIAKVGSTGYSSGPHLHFEIRQGTKALNPLPFMEKRNVDMQAAGVDTSR